MVNAIPEREETWFESSPAESKPKSLMRDWCKWLTQGSSKPLIRVQTPYPVLSPADEIGIMTDL